jgi:hypothetical protein
VGDSREEVDREHRVAEQDPCDPGDEGDQWRLIDVAPRQVVAAGDEVELVAEVPVAPVGEKVDEQSAEG